MDEPSIDYLSFTNRKRLFNNTSSFNNNELKEVLTDEIFKKIGTTPRAL